MATEVKRFISLGPSGFGQIPTTGLGTYTVLGQMGDAQSLRDAVKAAIDAGYRHFDCAWAYGNQADIGEAMKEKMDSGVVKREDLFVTTKLWNTHHNPAIVKEALQYSLKMLQLDYVDMYLIHWPVSYQSIDFQSVDYFPLDKDGNILFTSDDLLETYKAMEECQRAGLTKNIGLSNFNSKQIQRILDNCSIKPSNLQIEVHPYFSNKRLVEFCKERGIVVTAYAPFSAPFRPWREEGSPNPFQDPVLIEIAKKKGKSVAQIILRFLLQTGVCVIPKSVTPERIRENINVYDFELSPDDMKGIEALNRDFRVYEDSVQALGRTYTSKNLPGFGETSPGSVGHPEYPFHEPF